MRPSLPLCSSCLYSDARSDFSRFTSDGSSRPDCDASLAARTRRQSGRREAFASGEAAVSSASVVRTDRSSWRCESGSELLSEPWLLRRGGRTAAAAARRARPMHPPAGGQAGDASRERSGRLFTSRSHGAPVFVGAATCFPCTTSIRTAPELPAPPQASSSPPPPRAALAEEVSARYVCGVARRWRRGFGICRRRWRCRVAGLEGFEL